MSASGGVDKPPLAHANEPVASGTANSDVTSDVRPKRVVKLTAKAFCDKVERLQKDRKSNLAKAVNLRNRIQGLLLNGNVSEVQQSFDEFIGCCNDIRSMHGSLLSLLPPDECEKHDTWFKAKMLVNDECIRETQLWLKNKVQNGVDENGSNIKNRGESNVVEAECPHDESEISPEDSASNIIQTNKSVTSSLRSSTSSIRRAAAEKAAIMARMTALKELHKLEEQEQKLKRKKQQMELEAELAATTAKLNVLEAGGSRVSSNGMNSYCEKEERRIKSSSTLDPMAKPYRPVAHISQPQDWSLTNRQPVVDCRPKTQDWSLPHQPPAMDCRPKEAISFQLKSAKETRIHKPLVTSHPLSTMTAWPDQSSSCQQTKHAPVCLPPDSIIAIMHKQNEITASLVHQQRMLSLPTRDIPVFEGDPLHYQAFIRAFEQLVEDKASEADCLYYLEQFTSGQPKELVQSCQHMAPERGYSQAKHLLEQHFGNKYRIATAYIAKALAWPTIKTEDVKALQAYGLFLRGCCNVMGDLQYMQELDLPTNMRMIISKLPYKLREKWRSKAYEIMESSQERAHFDHLVRFLEKHVKMLSDPIFGDIDGASSNTLSNRFSVQSKYKGSSFATTVTQKDSGEDDTPVNISRKQATPLCLCCSRAHPLEECQQFNGKRHRDKISLLMEKGICFGCLGTQHISRDCSNRLVCAVCEQQHPTVLHINKTSKEKSAAGASVSPLSTVSQPSPSAPRAVLVTAPSETCGQTGDGKDRCILSIVPVQVKATSGSKVVQTYAFLDPGSSATFCSEDLMQKLNITGKRTNFLLTTMGQERIVPAYSLAGLEVSALKENNFYPLPETLTQRRMPVTMEHVDVAADVEKMEILVKNLYSHHKCQS